jgi:hypothetical protein
LTLNIEVLIQIAIKNYIIREATITGVYLVAIRGKIDEEGSYTKGGFIPWMS